MTLDGACLSTADEILSTLALPNVKRLSMTGHDIEKALLNVNNQTQINIENKIWPDVSVTLPNDYIARLKAGYNIETIHLNYSAPEDARNQINADVAKATHERIKDLIQPGGITNETKLVLTNAVYFKSIWKNEFIESKTYAQTFYGENGEHKVDMMHNTVKACIISCDGYELFDVPFSSSLSNDLKGAYDFRIILPQLSCNASKSNQKKALASIESKLKPNMLDSCQSKCGRVDLSLPKFKLEPNTMSITSILKSMGMNEAFTPNAKFYAMPNEFPPVESYLMLSDVIHKAFIEIDEKGGEAAAATAVVTKQTSRAEPKRETYNFTVDHPFIFMIREKSTGAIVFMGRVTDL